MRSSLWKIAAAALLAAGPLAGCGDEGETVPGTGTTGTVYTGTGSQRTSPSYTAPTTGTAGNGSVPGYGSVYGTVPSSLPGAGQATPSAIASPLPSARSGLEASITERQESGIFTKTLKGVTVSVANHDSVPRSRFLLVVFSKKGLEVDVQYKSLSMAPGSTATYSFKTSKDADDAKVELRDGLL